MSGTSEPTGTPQLAVRPTPTDEEAAAIAAAVQVVLASAAPAGPPPPPPGPPAWRFSGRWWRKPVAERRVRPYRG